MPCPDRVLRPLLPALAWAALVLASGRAEACATCGCSLASDGAVGFWTLAGWRLSLQNDYLDQDQLRHGTGMVTAAQVAALNTPPPGAGQEVEVRTLSRYTTLALAYAPSAEWSFRLQIPYVNRFHSSYGPDDNPLEPSAVSTVRISGLGDVKAVVTWQGLLPGHNLGFLLGVKLPTGNYGGQGANGAVGRNPASFGGTGALAGTVLDNSLQAGTGSTDLIAGAYWFEALGRGFNGYLTGQVQAPVAARLDQPGADYRPGRQGLLALGLRYETHPAIIPQLQINLMRRDADRGALGDTADTAGTIVYLSPGVEGRLASGVNAYGFIQLPLASNVSGYQLVPRWTATFGLTWHF